VPTSPLEVLVVVDRQGQARGEFWTEEVALYNRSHLSDGGRQAVCRLLPLADEVALAPTVGPETALELMERAQLLILNWDVANGDPGFGADAAQRWLAHHQYNVWDWVKRGGILVVEGQANWSIPTQEAYDAILGRGEIRVSGNEERLEGFAHLRRVGRACRFTRAARRSKLFESHRHFQLQPADRGWDQHFPDTSPDRPIFPQLRTGPWPMLWRGWLRRRLFSRSRFPWIAVMKTSDRAPNSQTTMLVAQYGKGAIFTTTMFLALGQSQPRILDAFLRCHGNTDLLPQRRRWTQVVSDYQSYLIVLAAAALFLLWPRLFHGDRTPEWLRYTATVLLTLALGLVRVAFRRGARLLRNLLGI
jgi:hypothetical protein